MIPDIHSSHFQPFFVLKLYQMYARQSPEVVHEILGRYGGTHIILEDSICMATQKADGCGTPSIMDVMNGEVSTARSCDTYGDTYIET